MTALEREEQDLEERLQNREISIKEFNAEMLELQRDCRAAAEEAAQEAYGSAMNDW